MALPGSLEKVAKALGLEHQKDQAGRRNMRAMAAPRKPRADEDPTKIYWLDDAERREKLYIYVKQDVAVGRAIHNRIGFLSPAEQAVWTLDQHINDRGLYIDAGSIAAPISSTSGRFRF